LPDVYIEQKRLRSSAFETDHLKTPSSLNTFVIADGYVWSFSARSRYFLYPEKVSAFNVYQATKISFDPKWKGQICIRSSSISTIKLLVRRYDRMQNGES